MTNSKNLAIEGLRGLCALSVLLAHVAYDSTTAQTSGASYEPILPARFIAAFADIGVLLFFVLSGYVIGLTVREPFSPNAAWRYMARRMLRLYPIYIIALIISFPLAGVPIVSTNFLLHMLFLQSWAVPVIPTNGVLWTLHLEFFFYLLFLLIWSGRVSLGVSLIATVACCIASPLVAWQPVRIIAYFFVWLLGLVISRSRNSSDPQNLFWPSVFLAISFTHISASEMVVAKFEYPGWHGHLSTLSLLIVSGVLAAAIMDISGRTSPTLRRWVAISTVASTLCVVTGLGFVATKPELYRFPQYQVAAVFACLAALSFATRPSTPTQALVRIEWLGSISYALYIIQNPIENFVYPRIAAGSPFLVWWSANAAVIVCAFALAYVLETWLQAPFRMVAARLGRRLPSGLRPSAP